MLPVGHVPIIERLVANLVRGGVTDVTLALGFKPRAVPRRVPRRHVCRRRLHYAVEPEPLDTAGAIRFAADATGIDDTFVVANGDVLTDLDIGALVAFHRRARRARRRCTSPRSTIRRRSVSWRRTRMGASQQLRREAGTRNGSQQPDQRRDVRARGVGARSHPGERTDVDRARDVPSRRRRTPTLRDGHRRLLDRHRQARPVPVRPTSTCCSASVGTTPASPWPTGATVAPTAMLHESLVSAGAIVGDAASVVHSVLLDGAVVGDGAVRDGLGR